MAWIRRTPAGARSSTLAALSLHKPNPGVATRRGLNIRLYSAVPIAARSLAFQFRIMRVMRIVLASAAGNARMAPSLLLVRRRRAFLRFFPVLAVLVRG